MCRIALGVVLHFVEHDDCVVEREAKNREERDHSCRSDLELQHRIDANGDDDVVHHGRNGCNRHLPFESPSYVQRHNQEEHE